jgi:hypothetical protein
MQQKISEAAENAHEKVGETNESVGSTIGEIK